MCKEERKKKRKHVYKLNLNGGRRLHVFNRVQDSRLFARLAALCSAATNFRALFL